MADQGNREATRAPNAWRRDHRSLLLSIFAAQFGFYVANPFIPLYVRELGVADLSGAALWSGVLIGVSALVAAVSTPLLGALTDRYGDRRMLIGMICSFTLVLFLMGFVQNVWQLLILRILNGAVAGLSPVVVAIMVAVVPAADVGYIVGSVNAVQFLPLAISPVIGGAVSAELGIRATFVIGALFGVLALIIVLFRFRGRSDSHGAEKRSIRTHAGVRGLWSPQLLLAAAPLFVIQFGEVSWSPILPLRLAELTRTAAEAQTATGVFYTLAALAYGSGAWLTARWGARPGALAATLGAACLGSVLAGIAGGIWDLAFGRVLVAGAGGASMTLAYARAISQLGDQGSKTAVGLLGGAAMLGRGVSPFASGAAAQLMLVSILFVNALLYMLCTALVLRTRRRPAVLASRTD